MNSEKNNSPGLIEDKIYLDSPKGLKPIRVDSFLTSQIAGATRTKIQKSISSGKVIINGIIAKASQKIKPGDKIECGVMRYPPLELRPENIPIEILYEDDDLLVVNKKKGMVTHPGLGNYYGTLVNAVLYHLGKREIIQLDISEDDDEKIKFVDDSLRPGIVHRLDKDTSGLLVVAKNYKSMLNLQSQFKDRSISREYNTIIWGKMPSNSGTIEGNIGRSPRNRKHFAVLKRGGKSAITDYEVIEEYSIASLVKVKLRTGRTHQIRVHFSNMGKSVMGDTFYNGDRIPHLTSKLKKSTALRCLSIATRQMLHAKKLSFIHPTTNVKKEIESDLPEDFKAVLEILEDNNKGVL
jgi:23S rRNA pseudouridine1911/1915/1917 synthase